MPAYYVKIFWNKDTGNEDVTDSIGFIYDSLKAKYGFDISIHDGNSTFSLEEIQLKGGGFIKDKSSDNLEMDEYLVLFILLISLFY